MLAGQLRSTFWPPQAPIFRTVTPSRIENNPTSEGSEKACTVLLHRFLFRDRQLLFLGVAPGVDRLHQAVLSLHRVQEIRDKAGIVVMFRDPGTTTKL